MVMRIFITHYQESRDCFSELTAVSDDHRLLGLTALGASIFHSLEDFHAAGDSAEDGVLAIEMRGLNEGDEELRAVGVLASVGHGEEAWDVVLVDEVLIVEFHAVDGLAASAVASGEVATLSHELSNDSVEAAALVVEGLAGLADALLTGAESSEVLRGDGGVGEELELDAASGLTTDRNVEEYFRVEFHYFFFYILLLLRREVY
jgi:hypothetical protein